MDWKEFKEKEKIFEGEPDKCPDGYMYLEEPDVDIKKEEFEKLVKKIEQAGIKEYKISTLTSEDGDYVGCFLESVTIVDLTISANYENPMHDEEETEGYAELLIKKKDG